MFRNVRLLCLGSLGTFILGLALIACLGPMAKSQEQPKQNSPLTEVDIIGLIKNQVEDKAIIQRIEKAGLAFPVDDVVLGRIKKAYPSPAVLTALEKYRPVAEVTYEPFASKTKGALLAKFPEKAGGQMYLTGNGKEIDSLTTFGSEFINTPLEIPPGTYTVELCGIKRAVTVQTGKTTVLQTGSLVVLGDTEISNNTFMVYDGKDSKKENGLLSNYCSLNNTPIALLPGTYQVAVNNTWQTIKIEPGRQTTLQTGTVVVQGDPKLGDGTFMVYQERDNEKIRLLQLYVTLNCEVALFPGHYQVEVTNTWQKAKIEPAKKTILQTGFLVVKGQGSYWNAVNGKVDCAIPARSIGSPMALFPGGYSVWANVGLENKTLTDNAKVEAGKLTVVTSN